MNHKDNEYLNEKKMILIFYRRDEKNDLEVTNENIANTFVNDTKTSFELEQRSASIMSRRLWVI